MQIQSSFEALEWKLKIRLFSFFDIDNIGNPSTTNIKLKCQISGGDVIQAASDSRQNSVSAYLPMQLLICDYWDFAGSFFLQWVMAKQHYQIMTGIFLGCDKYIHRVALTLKVTSGRKVEAALGSSPLSLVQGQGRGNSIAFLCTAGRQSS